MFGKHGFLGLDLEFMFAIEVACIADDFSLYILMEQFGLYTCRVSRADQEVKEWEDKLGKRYAVRVLTYSRPFNHL